MGWDDHLSPYIGRWGKIFWSPIPIPRMGCKWGPRMWAVGKSCLLARKRWGLINKIFTSNAQMILLYECSIYRGQIANYSIFLNHLHTNVKGMLCLDLKCFVFFFFFFFKRVNYWLSTVVVNFVLFPTRFSRFFLFGPLHRNENTPQKSRLIFQSISFLNWNKIINYFKIYFIYTYIYLFIFISFPKRNSQVFLLNF